MRSTPEPEPSFALSATDTGEVEYQPLEQAEPLHWAEVVGAAVSAETVNVAAAESTPAAFRAVTLWLPEGAVAEALKLYAPPPFDQPEPSAGKLVEATPVSGSLLGAVTVKPPVWPWRKKTLVPVVEAFVNDPNERLGVAGAVVSTFAVAATAAESLPTLSLIVNVYR